MFAELDFEDEKEGIKYILNFLIFIDDKGGNMFESFVSNKGNSKIKDMFL